MNCGRCRYREIPEKGWLDEKKVAYRDRHEKVFICSPFKPKGTTAEERKEYRRYHLWLAKIACKYAVSHNYMPMAPHLFFPQFLSDADMDERETGIQMGIEWLAECDALWVIGRYISEGMKQEIAYADEHGIPVIRFEVRSDYTCRCCGCNGDFVYDSYNYRKNTGFDDEEGLLYDSD